MKKHHIVFPQESTIEKLESSLPSYNSALAIFSDKILITVENVQGNYETAIYKFIETPKATGSPRIKCGIKLAEVSDNLFRDSEQAIAMTIRRNK